MTILIALEKWLFRSQVEDMLTGIQLHYFFSCNTFGKVERGTAVGRNGNLIGDLILNPSPLRDDRAIGRFKRSLEMIQFFGHIGT